MLRERSAEQLVDGHRPGHAARGGAAETAGQRHLLVHAKADAGPAGGPSQASRRQFSQDGCARDAGNIARGVARKLAPVSGDVHNLQAGRAALGFNHVAGPFEGKAEHVEAGAEVADRGWGEHADEGGHRPHRLMWRARVSSGEGRFPGFPARVHPPRLPSRTLRQGRPATPDNRTSELRLLPATSAASRPRPARGAPRGRLMRGCGGRFPAAATRNPCGPVGTAGRCGSGPWLAASTTGSRRPRLGAGGGRFATGDA